MAITPVKTLVERANREITTHSPAEALSRQSAGGAVLVDIRDIRELDREGRVDGALHAPRGMLEFWFDPQSPYHKQVFAQEGREYILFCAAGWRSALATKALRDMGFDNVAHIEGGFGALRESGASINAGDKA
ncbi:MAG: rhodanese-like domain-containing protein [Nitratireductor sp.]|nr:rhodanese-like domain-containing protein [Nitratireductor sp.]